MEFKIFKYSWHFGNHSWTGTEQWKFWVVQGVCSQLRLNRTILCLLVLALIMWTRVILQSSYEKTQMNFSANPIFTAIFSPPYMVFFVFFFFCFFFFGVCVCVILLFKMAFMHSAEVLSSVPKHKTVISYRKIMCVW